MSVFIGIDPGLSGGLVAIDHTGSVIGQMIMPRTNGSKGPLDTSCILSWLLGVKGPGACAALERASTRPGQSATSTLTCGVNWGRLDALLVALGIRYVVPTPQQWKRSLSLPKRSAKERDQGKVDAVELVRCLFPDMDLTPGKRTTPHDGLADAVLIAEYARRTLS
mgnify:CR=1 FL=1|tara:strand:+ start:4461 stop:4958 length:498 start_codon:yes stop_codon:yes gene_type:complete